VNAPRSGIASVPYGHTTFRAACKDILTGMGSNCLICRSTLMWFCSYTAKHFAVLSSLVFIVQSCNCTCIYSVFCTTMDFNAFPTVKVVYQCDIC